MLRRRDDDAHDDSKTMQLFAITASARRLAELSHSVSITLRSPDGSLDVSYIYIDAHVHPQRRWMDARAMSRLPFSEHAVAR